MNRTLTSLYFCFTKTNAIQIRLVTTTRLSTAHDQEVVTKLATSLQRENCPMHLAETPTTLRNVSSSGDCHQITDKMMGVVKHFSLACTDSQEMRCPRRRSKRCQPLVIPLWGKGREADLNPLPPCKSSVKMSTERAIYQCLAYKTVNNVRTNGQIRNMV